MSLAQPRLALRCSRELWSCSSRLLVSRCPATQRRHKSSRPAPPQPSKPSNLERGPSASAPLNDQIEKNAERAITTRTPAELQAEVDRRMRENTIPLDAANRPPVGGLNGTSIFNHPDVRDKTLTELEREVSEGNEPLKRNFDVLMANLDPVPSKRKRFLRQKIIKELQTGGRVSKALEIRRAEREMKHRTERYNTSYKKLGMLAKQIAGKTVKDAITQMQFSKKKHAAFIQEELKVARDKATAKAGMGLGKANGTRGPETVIRLKDGTKRKISDRTEMYIDQAYVGRGPYGQDSWKRARGRVDRLRLPTSYLFVILKEEATRIRLHEEREEKERKKKPWLHLPDRKIYGQRPYYCW